MLEMDVMQGDEGIQLEVFEELDADIISILHHFFDSLTDMEKLFVSRCSILRKDISEIRKTGQGIQ